MSPSTADGCKELLHPGWTVGVSRVDHRTELGDQVYRTPVQHHRGDFASNVDVKVNSFLPKSLKFRDRRANS